MPVCDFRKNVVDVVFFLYEMLTLKEYILFNGLAQRDREIYILDQIRIFSQDVVVQAIFPTRFKQYCTFFLN